MSWEAFFFNLRRRLVIFHGRFSCVCLTRVTHRTQTHKYRNTQDGKCAHEPSAHTHLHPPALWQLICSSGVLAVGVWACWVGLLILTAWPCLASCQCWASSHWLLWPPINQGQLPRWCTAASPPVTALPCRVQGGREEGREATSLLSFQLLLWLPSSLFGKHCALT